MITIIIITTIIVTAGLGLPEDTPEQYKQTLKSWKTAIIDNVEDEEREEQALLRIDSAAKTMQKSREDLNNVLVQIVEVDTRYDATLEDYEAIIASLDAIWHRNDMALVDKRFEIREVLTEEEWLVCLEDVKTATFDYREKLKKKVAKDDEKRAKQIEKLEKSQ